MKYEDTHTHAHNHHLEYHHGANRIRGILKHCCFDTVRHICTTEYEDTTHSHTHTHHYHDLWQIEYAQVWILIAGQGDSLLLEQRCTPVMTSRNMGTLWHMRIVASFCLFVCTRTIALVAVVCCQRALLVTNRSKGHCCLHIISLFLKYLSVLFVFCLICPKLY